MANRYWVAGSTNNWSDTSNWSLTSGGAGGASVPGPSDDAIFNSSSSNHNCTLDQNVDVNSWYYPASGYSGTIDCVTYDVTTAGNLWGRSGATLYMGTGTFNVGGSFSGRDGNLYGQTATLRFTTLNGSLNLSNFQKDSGPYLEVASGAKCILSFTGNKEIRGLDCYGELNFNSGSSGNSLEVNGDITIRSTGSLTNFTAGAYLRTQTSSNPTVTLEAGASVGSIEFTTRRANPSTNSTLTLAGAGWATATGATLYASYQTTTTGRWTYVFPSVINIAHIELFPRYSSSRVTFDFSTNSTQLSLSGSFQDVSTYTNDTYDISVGTSTLTFDLAANATFSPRGNTFPPIIIGDNATGTLTLDSDVTTAYVHDCADQIDENGYTVTTTGTDPSPCSTGARYWVGLVDTDYENTGNWSTSSGGLGNASVPVGTNDVIFDGNGLVNCTMTNNRFANTLDVQTAYVNTFSLASFALSVAGNATADSNLAVSTGTLSCQGDVDIYPLQASGGTLTLNGSAQVLTLGGNSANVVTDLNIDGSTVTTANNGPSRRVASGAWVVNNGGSFTYSGGLGCNSISVGSGSFVTQTANTTTVDTGGIPQNDGYIDIVNLQHSNQNNGTYYWDAGDYRNTALKLEGNNETHTFGKGVVKIKSLTVNASRSGRSATIANTTNDPNFEFSGNVNLNPTTGSVVWNAGDGTIILNNVISQSIDFNGQTVEGIHVTDASTGSIVLADSFSTAWLRDCNSLIDLNGYTITNADTEDRCAYPYDPPTTIALDSSKSINTDLVGWWPMVNESGSLVTDLSGNGWDATSAGTAIWRVDDRGYHIQGSSSVQDDYWNTSGFPLDNVDAFTISLWFDAANGNGDFLGCWPGTYQSGKSVLFRNNSMQVYVRNAAGSSEDFIQITGSLGSGMKSIVAVFDSGNAKVYIDGSLDVEDSSFMAGPYLPSGSSSFGIGNARTASISDGQKMQNIRLWSRALTSTEVASLYSDPWIGSDYTAVVPLTNRYFAPAAFRRLG